MKKFISIFIVLLIFSKISVSQSRVFENCTNWCSWFPVSTGIITNSVEPDDHNGIIYFQGVGFGYSFPATVGKIDSTGAFSWAKTLTDSIPIIHIININDTTIEYESNYSEIIHIPSGGYCLTGYVNIHTTVKDSTGVIIYSGYSGMNIVTRVDSSANVIWCKSYENYFSGNEIVYNQISGKYCVFGPPQQTTALLLLDSLGNIDWAGEIPANNNITTGISTKDGNFLFAAINNGNAEIIKLDTNGNFLFAHSFTNTSNVTSLKAIELNHNIVLRSNETILMCDSNGQIIWTKNMLIDSTVSVIDLAKFNDNYFSIIVGKITYNNTPTSSSSTTRYYFINIDSAGNILNHCFATTASSYSILISPSSYYQNYKSCQHNYTGFAFHQTVRGHNNAAGYFNDNLITQTDSLGCSCNTDTISISPSLIASTNTTIPISLSPVVLTFISSDYLIKSLPYNPDFYLFCSGYAAIHELTNKSSDNFRIIPNPTSNEFLIEKKLLNGKKSPTLIISDINGKILQKRTFVDDKPISVSDMKNGVYLVQLIGDNKIYNAKLVVIH
ncbi:MAG: T9SS type A sorting domain-containing protein [Bacteroidia bacterium]